MALPTKCMKFKLNPIGRFKQVPETIIHNTYSGSSCLNPDSIKVLSWNIAKNNYDPNWSKDFLAIVGQYRPDKIFLQEVRLPTDVGEIPELARMKWTFTPNFIDTYDRTYLGILTATKGDCFKSQALITKHYEPVSNTPKVSLFTEYFIGDRHIIAVNTHLINFVNLNKFKAQLQEIESIVAAYEGAIILAGDFNTWNKSRRQMLDRMTARLNLTPVSFTAENTKKIKSFLLSPPLDYIFYRGLVQKPNTAEVIDNSSSDHNPLFVELSFKDVADRRNDV